jgi:cyanophycinase
MTKFALWNAAIAIVLLVTKRCDATDFEYQLTGSAEDVRPHHTTGALMLSGGGGSVDDAFRWFVQKAGHRNNERVDIVLLKASDRDETTTDTFGEFLYKTIGGCDSVEVIVFHHRNASSDPTVLKVIQNADGIFLGGGKQFLYADFWKGTPVEDAIHAHVRSGKPLGGSSAGLAVLGQFCYTAHVTARLTSQQAMLNPFHESLTLENDFLNLELMKGVFTDSHLSQRERLGRLITFVARTFVDTHRQSESSLLGIGVDEKTSLCVEANGLARVISGIPDGRAWFVIPQEAPEIIRENEPLSIRNVKVVAAGPDSEIDLLKRSISKPAISSTYSVEKGNLSFYPQPTGSR